MQRLALVVLAACSAHRAPPPSTRPAPSTRSVRPTAEVPTPPSPYAQLAVALHEVAAERGERLELASRSLDETELPAFEPCVHPSEDDRAAIAARVTAWADRAAPGEPRERDKLELRLGCVERTGIVASLQIDRLAPSGLVGHWWILRVARDRIDVIDQRRGNPRGNGDSLSVFALVDVDGDGLLDVVARRERAIPNDVVSELAVHVARGRPGTYRELPPGAFELVRAQRAAHGPFVVWSQTNDPGGDYHCITTAGLVPTCPEAVWSQRHLAARDVVRRLRAVDPASPTSIPDRDQLEAMLVELGLSAPQRAPLIAMAPPTTAQDRVLRAIEKLRATHTSTADEAASNALYAAIRASFGDAPCTGTSDQDPVARAWVRRRDVEATEVRLQTVCTGPRGAYIEARWTVRDLDHAALLFVGGGTATPIAEAPNLQAEVHRHGAAMIALVLREHSLVAGVDGAIVGAIDERVAGASFEIYRFSELVVETVDDARTYWHAGPSGLERLFEHRATNVFMADGTTPLERRIVDFERRDHAWSAIDNATANRLDDADERAELAKALAIVGADPALRVELDRLP